jgi:hypothetical protein
MHFGIDFRHAVEFSRIGRTPRFRLSFEAPGQLAQLYCFASGRSNRPFSIQSPCATQCPKPAEACFGFRDLQGVCWRAGRFRVLRFRPTRRTLLTFVVRMQIGVPDRCPRLPAPVLDPGDPAPREAVLVPLVTTLTRVSASDTSIMPHPHKWFSCGGETTRWEPVSRLPPVTYSTVQWTPLGGWPLVAA